MKPRSIRRKFTIKTKTSRFDSLVARYYPAVYSLASRMTDDPRQAVALAHDALESTRKRLGNRRGETAFASILIAAVIRAGLTIA
jgi:DNA-directed RNA polymerase specialized sigma24 family protein